MKALRTLSASLLVAALAVACSDSEGPTGGAEDVDDLVGTWNATVMEFTNSADNTQKVDLISEGASVTLTITSNGRYTFDMSFPGEGAEADSGTFTLSGSNITINSDNPEDPEAETLGYTLSGNTLTMLGDDTFDFDEDGTEETATMRLVFTRS